MPALGLLLILGTLQSVPNADDAEAQYLARIRTEFQRCGVRIEPGAIRYEAMLQGYAVSIDRTDLSDGEIDCMAGSTVFDAMNLEFAVHAFDERYQRALMERPDIRAMLDNLREQQSQWLEARGLLASLPKFERGGDLGTFAREMEVHCGIIPGTVLIADAKSLTLRFVFAPGLSPESLTCLHTAVAVSDPWSQGVLGLITGEAVDVDD